tara:strand:- start:2580 stop:3281 length:702 start_codon:yes stop_codon:yes gene_type:complete
VWANKSHPEPEGLLRILPRFDELAGLGGSPSVRVDKIVPVGLYNYEGVPTYGGFFAVRIVLKGFSITGCSPFGTLAVESLGPGGLIISAVASSLDPTGDSHVIDLTHPRGVVSIVDEVLGPCGTVSDSGPGIPVAQFPGGVGVVARHEGSTGWTAVCALAVGSGKARPTCGKTINVGSLTDLIAVARKRRVGKVVGNEEDDVILREIGRGELWSVAAEKNTEKKNRPLHITVA